MWVSGVPSGRIHYRRDVPQNQLHGSMHRKVLQPEFSLAPIMVFSKFQGAKSDFIYGVYLPKIRLCVIISDASNEAVPSGMLIIKYSKSSE